MEEINLLWGLGGTAVVAGLIQAVKMACGLADTVWTRILPFVAIGLGVGWNALVGSVINEGMQWNVIILLGILTGLSACGLYAGQKAVRGQ